MKRYVNRVEVIGMYSSLPAYAQEIDETLKRINREKGVTLLVVEQKIDFARQLAQKFFIMEKGSIVAKGQTSALTDSLGHQYLVV